MSHVADELDVPQHWPHSLSCLASQKHYLRGKIVAVLFLTEEKLTIIDV